jgi:hypothetical protein
MQRFIALAYRLILGLTLMFAGIGKLLDVSSFSQALLDYDVLPPAIIPAMAFMTSTGELLIGILLLLGLYTRYVSAGASCFLLLLLGLSIYELITEPAKICTCFGLLHEGIKPLDRVIILIALTFMSALHMIEREHIFSIDNLRNR